MWDRPLPWGRGTVKRPEVAVETQGAPSFLLSDRKAGILNPDSRSPQVSQNYSLTEFLRSLVEGGREEVAKHFAELAQVPLPDPPQVPDNKPQVLTPAKYKELENKVKNKLNDFNQQKT